MQMKMEIEMEVFLLEYLIVYNNNLKKKDMKNALMIILKSKRFLYGISGIIIPVIMKAFDLDAELADRVWQTALLLIVGQSASDWGKNSK